MIVRDNDKFSQASVRSYAIFRDQHGRKWGADIEQKTGAPCGPLSARFSAPIMPPQKYLKVTDVAARELTIDYEAWLGDLETAHMEYDQRRTMIAVTMYNERAHDAIEKKDPALMQRVGPPPQFLEPIMAAVEGNGWILGFDGFEMPEEAKPFFPTPEQPKRAGWGGAIARQAKPEEKQYPEHIGGGKWKLSNGTEVGPGVSRADATAREKEIAEDEIGADVPVGAGVHNSWGA